MKTCSKCKMDRPLTEFYAHKQGRGGLLARCKSCYRTKAREWEANNKEKTTGWHRAYYIKNREKFAVRGRADRLRRKFGLTVAAYDAMLASQDGGCAICGSAVPGGVGRFHVDHDHTTGLIRGLLCNNHNVGLGAFGDSIPHLLAAVAYLRRGDGQ